jgi:hypothetical protein
MRTRTLFMLLVAVAASGCAYQKVQPYERGDLTRPEMAWEPGFLEAAIQGHTYVSKEAASGGAALAGGGCGCN